MRMYPFNSIKHIEKIPHKIAVFYIDIQLVMGV